ncbi:MAG: hypothetical protein KC912_24325 [Proteobacteria bacterium]|nr:hypothetical protein [Pseudomonadota bacterium]
MPKQTQQSSDQQQTQATTQTTDTSQVQQQSNGQSQDSLAKAKAKVPRTSQDVIAAIRGEFGSAIKAYEEATKTARGEFKPLLDEIRAYKPGTMTKDQSKDYLGRYMAISKKIAAETNSTEGKDLRGIYVGAEELMADWQHALEVAGEDAETVAQLMHMYRETKKMYVRSLMIDENAVACLNGRDTALYGQPMGPSFEQLFEQAKARGADTDEDAYRQIIGSSKRSNQDVNKSALGSNTSGASSGQTSPKT